MTDSPDLVVLAAGAGRRFGGLKQLAPVGPAGEALLEFTIHDALTAGFGRIVIVVSEASEAPLRSRLERLDRECVFVRQPPESPRSPRGTASALLAARESVERPFAVVNGDDFYGRESLELAAAALGSSPPARAPVLTLVGFPVQETLSVGGPVSRALCEVDAEGWLVRLRELPEVRVLEGRIVGRYDGGAEERIAPGTLVSMNLWCAAPALFPLLDRARGVPGGQAEFQLPSAIALGLDRGWLRVRVVRGPGRWCGLTFAADLAPARERMAALTEERLYPTPLWRRAPG